MKRAAVDPRPDPQTAPAEGTPLAAVKSLLAEYNIGLSFGLSPQTGQRVMRLVDDRTGEPSRQLPSAVRHRLAGFAARLAAGHLER
ncbi:MAG: hypothetical protein KGN76_02610 [Acidobacteriota bacterium]|nr:hypothetical protein [Acidobacteriota bacterium]